jgi:hypothetical protein
MSLCGSKSPLYDLSEMFFARRAHMSLDGLLYPAIRIVAVRQHPSQGMPSL